MGNSFGSSFRITTYGESHGGSVGVIIDGCPSKILLSCEMIQAWLDRRKPGQSHLTTPRGEPDTVEILSGVEGGVTLGTPISLMVRNRDAKPGHYGDLKEVYRPSHADYTTHAKYGIRPGSGGGRASARETIGRVAAAAVAEQVLQSFLPDFAVVAWVASVGSITMPEMDGAVFDRTQVDGNIVRCPDEDTAKTMIKAIEGVRKDGDSLGGTIHCVARGLPPGLGEPVFDKLEAELAKGIMSLPACKGFEIGSGFAAAELKGSEHNDAFYTDEKGRVRTETNRSGGVQGGISNGEDIVVRAAFKPVSTIFKDQKSVTSDGEGVTFRPRAGRHDPCVLPRAVPMVEAMVALVLADHFLRQKLREATRV